MGIVCLAVTAWAAEGSFTSAGLELHYRTSGSGSPLVVLSGGPGLEVDYMIPAAEGLSSSYERIFLEQRGTRRSRPASGTMTAENISLKLMLDDLEALRIHLKQERLLILGHSWGGMYAMAFAASYPEHVDRLILVDSGGMTMAFGQEFGDNIEARLRAEDLEAQQYWADAEKRGVDREKAGLEGMRAILPGYFFERAKGLAFAASLKDGAAHRDVPAALNPDLRKSYDARAGLAKLDRPVLIVHAHQDPMGDKVPEDIPAAIKTSRIAYINRFGHFPWVEQPEEYRKIVNAFLDGK